MFLKRTLAFLLSLLSLTMIVGGVSATFNYSQSKANDAISAITGSMSEFNYSSNPPDFGDDEQTVVEVALDDLNDDSTMKGYKYAISLSGLQGVSRDGYGYVGSMDKWWSFCITAPEGLSVIMTLPAADPLGKDGIYLYIARITKTELDAKQVGDVLSQVFRVRIEKNSDGDYEQTECKSGYSPVTLYEYAYYQQQSKKIKGFAIFNGETVWKESA